MTDRALTIVKPESRHVPCAGCTACCHKQSIYLTKWDRPKLYHRKRFVAGRWQLGRSPNGDCAYLDRRAGCTIHDRKPVQCRWFDCRDATLKGYLLSPQITSAAMERMPEHLRERAENAISAAMDEWGGGKP